METVEERKAFSSKALVLAAVFVIYFIAGFAFFHFGLQPTISASDAYAKESEAATATLSISTIDLEIPVVSVSVTNHELDVPEQIVGSYSAHPNKTLLVGHSSTAFVNLKNLSLGDQIVYNSQTYTVSNLEQKEKSTISMKEILKGETTDTLVLMTCAGQQITKTDFSDRLIVTAVTTE